MLGSTKWAGLGALTAALVATVLASASSARDRKEAEAPALVPARVNDVVVVGSLAFVGQTGALVIHDFADPANPAVIGKLGRPGQVLGVAMDGEYAYLASGSFGVAVADVSRPDEPLLVSRYDTPGSARRIAVREGIAAVADDGRGLEIVSFKTPSKPRAMASISTRDVVRGVAWRETLLATAEGAAGVRLFDMSSPATPRRVATIESRAGALDVALCGGGLLVVAQGDAGVSVWDVTDPANPRSRGSAATPGRARSVSCADGLVAVGCGDRGVALVSVRQDDSPRRLSATKLGRLHPAERVFLAGRTVAVAADVGGLGVLAIDDPAAPTTLLPRERPMRITFP